MYHTFFYYTFKVWYHKSDSKHLEAIASRGKQGTTRGRGERRRRKRRSRGGRNPRRRYFRGGSGEKTVSKAQIVSPFPAERCTVHLKTSRLPVTARPRQFFIRYTQNASHLSSVSISSSASLFRGDGGPYRQKSESSFRRNS